MSSLQPVLAKALHDADECELEQPHPMSVADLHGPYADAILAALAADPSTTEAVAAALLYAAAKGRWHIYPDVDDGTLHSYHEVARILVAALFGAAEDAGEGNDRRTALAAIARRHGPNADEGMA